jgi:replicative DNA helicase
MIVPTMATITHIPPHNLEAERSVLGAILLTGTQALEAIMLEERLRPEHFYRDQHALVYAAMLALARRHEPIDTLTVCAQLTQNGALEQAGGSAAVDELAGWVPASGHFRAYARIVRDLATRRAVLNACYEIQKRTLEGRGDVEELLADASKRVGDLHDRSLPAGSRQMHWVLATGWAKDTPPLVVCERAPLTFGELRSEALRWRRRLPHGLSLIVVDYLQLLSARTGDRFANRYELVSEISRSLKMLAKELQIPVLAIARLSREAGRRPDKRPQLSDLRDSGAPEQDANTVLLLYRADLYDEHAEPGHTEVIIAKARNAQCTTVELEFEGAYQTLRARG